jgi:[methyl-Co(III) methanol-specific corrinoid protein]:coenzyme M methyltransferase
MPARAEILALLNGLRPPRPPAFSGLINVTQAGLESLGLTLAGAHAAPGALAAAARSTFTLTGLPAAVAPLDLCVEAEALGAAVDYREGENPPEFPRVAQTAAGLPADFRLPGGGPITARGRLPIVAEALARLRAEAGDDLVVGGSLPGPFTLALQVVDAGPLMLALMDAPGSVGALLEVLTDVLVEVGGHYRAAGADFITVHEMGGSPGYLGPGPFERLVLPALQRLIGGLPAPRVLSVCGRTNRAMPLLAAAGADALSVDQTNDLAASRQTLGAGALLFGNLDPVGVLAQGHPAAVRDAARAAVAAGADAVWPGCDLYPLTPPANLRAMVAASAAADADDD